MVLSLPTLGGEIQSLITSTTISQFFIFIFENFIIVTHFFISFDQVINKCAHKGVGNWHPPSDPGSSAVWRPLQQW